MASSMIEVPTSKVPASPMTPETTSTATTTPSPKKRRGKKKCGRDFHKTALVSAVTMVDEREGESPVGRSNFSSLVYTCCGQPFQIHIVYSTEQDYLQSPGRTGSGTDLAIVYTSGLQDCGFHVCMGGFAEMIVFDVPTCKVQQVCQLFSFLVHRIENHRLIKGGEIIDSDNLVMETRWIACPQLRARLAYRFPFLTGLNDFREEMHPSSPSFSTCKWLAIQPQFPYPIDGRYSRLYQQRQWGARPAAPRGDTKLRDRIVDLFMMKVVLTDPGATFLWHVDGNPLNNSYANTQEVTLHEVFMNPSWNIDLSYILDGDETLVSYTRSFMSHFATIFKPRNDKTFTKQDVASIRFKYHQDHCPYSPAGSLHYNRELVHLEISEFHDAPQALLPEAPPFGV